MDGPLFARPITHSTYIGSRYIEIKNIQLLTIAIVFDLI